jgi:hypothetical protein
MRSGTKVAEEYCWAITQAAERSWCRRSCASVLPCMYAVVLNSDLHRIGLVQSPATSGLSVEKVSTNVLQRVSVEEEGPVL